jgi:hypothetical protein
MANNDDDHWRDDFRGWRRPLDANGTYRGMDLARIGMEQVIEGKRRSLMVCGGSGCGKSYLLQRLLKAWNLPLLPPMDVATEAAMIKYAWRHRHARVVPVEDNSKMLRQETLIDRLKQMTDVPARLHYETDDVMTNMRRMTVAEQVLAHLAETDPVKQRKILGAALRNPDIPESDFEVEFGMIITTNTNYTLPENIPPAMRPHWQAMLGRGLNPRWIPDDAFDVFEYALHLVFEQSSFRALHLKLDDANAVLRAFIENRGHLTDVSPRTLRLMATLRKDLRQSDRLAYWEREFQSGFLSDQVSQPVLAKRDVPVFQIPPPPDRRYAPVTVMREPQPGPKPDPTPEPEPDPKPDPPAPDTPPDPPTPEPDPPAPDTPPDPLTQEPDPPASGPGPTETASPEPRPVHETSLLERFNALRARRLAKQQPGDARQPTETPPPRPRLLHEMTPAQQRDALGVRRAAQQAGETPKPETKPASKPEPYEYSENQPDYSRKRTKADMRRDRNRAEALRIAGGVPRRHHEWGNVATRVKGDCAKYGWIRIVNYPGAGNVPLLTDEGRVRLERYEENDPLE